MDSTGPDLDATGPRPYLLQVMWIPSGMDRPDLDSIVPARMRSGFDLDWICFRLLLYLNKFCQSVLQMGPKQVGPAPAARRRLIYRGDLLSRRRREAQSNSPKSSRAMRKCKEETEIFQLLF